MTQSTIIEPERCSVFLLENSTVWHSEPMRIGKHDWIIVVFNHDRYGRCTEYCFRGPRAPSYLPETTFVPADQFWPTYNGDHCDGGMPKSLQRLYDRNKATICRLLAEGGKS
jgi:hypothetical protein